MHKSLWYESVELPEFPSLDKNIKTDVLIIGGGICGILCAYFLKQSGIRCVLLEKGKIAQGVTANTTAKITSLHGLIYNNLIKKFGKEAAEKYLYANEEAIKKYSELCKNIDCDFLYRTACTYSKNNLKIIEKEVNALNSLGMNAKLSLKSSLPFEFAGAVEIDNQAQFNPLKFIKSIVKDLTIYENTAVIDIASDGVVCENAKVKAEKIIVATHFPFWDRHGSYFLKLYQHRSYVLALENAQEVDGMYVDEDDLGLSFRSSDNLLLLGGGGERTGKKCGNWTELENFSKKYYPNSKIKYKWATQDCMSLDKIPYIGLYYKNNPNLFVATGFNKWGMTSSMVSASVLCDMINEKQHDYADIFSPSRSILKPQLFVNGIETISNYVIPTTRRCPHLGCALKWNKYEHTWDCSCHGSRFDKKGNLINNPATKDANV